MKKEILGILRIRDGFVSGQELSRLLGVSRTVIWKTVGQLKKEGYAIEAVRNRGYLLTNADDVYSQNELEQRIVTKWAGKPVSFYESVGSTNIQAKIDAENGASHGTLIAAEMQTAGRGRRGREWNSPPGSNLYFSLILKPDFPPAAASMLTLVMAFAIARGIESTADEEGVPQNGRKPAEIKWPNDIVINGKKVCGILTEMSAERDYIHYVVIGCGVNVRKQDFLPEVAAKATDLESEFGKKISRSRLLANIMKAFESEYDIFLEKKTLEDLKDRYNAILVNRNREVCVLDPKGKYSGVAGGINELGELLVELPDGGVKQVYAGEVSVRGIYGYV